MNLLCVAIIGAVFLGVCNATPLNNDEVEAKKFATEFSVKVNSYLDNLANTTFSNNEEDLTGKYKGIGTLVVTSAAMVEMISDAKKFDYKNFKDPELKNIFSIINKYADVAVLGPDRYLHILMSLRALENLASDKDIENFNDDYPDLAYFPDIQNIIKKSNNSEKLFYYWNQWRVKNGDWALKNFADLVKGLRDAANKTGISAYEFWMKDHDIREMEEVMTQIQPFYSELHAFMRSKLVKKYGIEVIKPDGLIPDYLFQQVLAQAWTSRSIIDDVYPHKDLPPFNSILKQKDFDTLKIFKTADQFYQSLGFEPIPDDFWGKQLRMKKTEDEGDCKASIYDYTSNIYMEYCQKMDFRKFLQAHGYMGELYYAREMNGLPAYYFDTNDLDYPVGEAVILSASTAKHLKTLGLVTEDEYNGEVLMNRLIRFSIHTMINIPVYFVHTKAMSDLLSGAVDMANLNRYYWELMDKYVGVGPPDDGNYETLDFPYTFYIELKENRQARKFNSEVLGYQFYKKMCSISGQYPKESLQNCDFYGSKEVGDALKKMMKLGSSKPFNEVLATFLPEDPKLNAESLLEYYRPVQTWLKEKNHEADVKYGWTHLEKKGTVQPVKSRDED